MRKAVADGDWQSLWDKDQYDREHNDNKVLYGFDTFPHDFPPTYKYFRTEDVQKKRCDADSLHENITDPSGNVRQTRVYTEVPYSATLTCLNRTLQIWTLLIMSINRSSRELLLTLAI